MMMPQANPKRLLLPVLTLMAVINALLPAIMQSLNEPLLVAASSGFGQSYVLWFSLFLSAFLLSNTQIKYRAQPRGFLLYATLISTLMVLPNATLSWVLCSLCCGIWLKQICGQDGKHTILERSAVLILFAISIRSPVCQLLLSLFSNEILNFDAWFSGIFLQILTPDAIVENNLITQESGHSLLILTGCSALGNLSWAMLLWFSLTTYLHHTITTRAYLRIVCVVVLILSINSIRLSLMALDEQWYLQLHEGDGADFIEAITLLLTLTCVKWKKS
ncbi:hypothetical protein [Neptunomonas japonica]|uniref:hypothetical protein n=1 Tax=Neptunomonas japonica TaxID=417574 RepID=UPI0004049263|nr:hypothetical protein [Neptunomonas japonica]